MKAYLPTWAQPVKKELSFTEKAWNKASEVVNKTAEVAEKMIVPIVTVAATAYMKSKQGLLADQFEERSYALASSLISDDDTFEKVTGSIFEIANIIRSA